MGFAIERGSEDMRDARLNLLLANPPVKGPVSGGQLWQQTVAQLLMPLGVRTFEAHSGPAAVELVERHPIHLAVVDTRLPGIGGVNVLQLIQRLKENGKKQVEMRGKAPELGQKEDEIRHNLGGDEAKLGAFEGGMGTNRIQFQMRMFHRSQEGKSEQHIEVRFESRGGGGSAEAGAVPYAPGAPPPGASGPVVILIAPPPQQQDKELLREALKFNAFSVLSEPVEVEVALDVMARAMKRWFLGQWPT
jgi:hypothetical protein